MKKVCMAVAVSLLPSWGYAQPAATKMLSKEAALAGVITMVAGAALMTPGGDTYHVDGDAFCVETYAISTGGCTVSDTRRKIGAWTLVGGAALTVIGLQRVRVSPSRTGMGANVTVQWGGSR